MSIASDIFDRYWASGSIRPQISDLISEEVCTVIALDNGVEYTFDDGSMLFIDDNGNIAEGQK